MSFRLTTWYLEMRSRTAATPAALPNDRARGMRLYDTVTAMIDDPGPAAGPWSGTR